MKFHTQIHLFCNPSLHKLFEMYLSLLFLDFLFFLWIWCDSFIFLSTIIMLYITSLPDIHPIIQKSIVLCNHCHSKNNTCIFYCCLYYLCSCLDQNSWFLPWHFAFHLAGLSEWACKNIYYKNRSAFGFLGIYVFIYLPSCLEKNTYSFERWSNNIGRFVTYLFIL